MRLPWLRVRVPEFKRSARRRCTELNRRCLFRQLAEVLSGEARIESAGHDPNVDLESLRVFAFERRCEGRDRFVVVAKLPVGAGEEVQCLVARLLIARDLKAPLGFCDRTLPVPSPQP